MMHRLVLPPALARWLQELGPLLPRGDVSLAALKSSAANAFYALAPAETRVVRACSRGCRSPSAAVHRLHDPCLSF